MAQALFSHDFAEAARAKDRGIEAGARESLEIVFAYPFGSAP